MAVLAACGDNGGDKTAACHLGMAASNVAVQDRKVIGVAAPYAADLGLAARDEELRTSIAARREAAWQVVERVLHPVPLGDPRLAQNFGGVQPEIPAWHTWYARDDFERTFKKLYRDLGPAGRRARAPIDAAAGLAWNAVALDELPEWPEQRYLDYLAAIDTQRRGRRRRQRVARRLQPRRGLAPDPELREGVPVPARPGARSVRDRSDARGAAGHADRAARARWLRLAGARPVSGRRGEGRRDLARRRRRGPLRAARRRRPRPTPTIADRRAARAARPAASTVTGRSTSRCSRPIRARSPSTSRTSRPMSSIRRASTARCRAMR